MVIKIKYVIGFLAIILGVGIGLGYYQEHYDAKPSWVRQVEWQDNNGDKARIEGLLWNEISPYQTEYETVNISTSKMNNGLRLKVTAVSKDADRPDIYDFLYEDEKLILTGYILEAIPFQARNEAIGVAAGNKEFAALNTGLLTVKRILPQTSEKFYAPKILISVTKGENSVLIDPGEKKVVQVWNASSPR